MARDGLSEYPQRDELDRWARSVVNRAPLRVGSARRPWPSPVRVGAVIFLYRALRGGFRR